MRLFPSPQDADLIKEKQSQAIAALDRLDIDAWLVFVREGGDSHIVSTIAGPEFIVQNAALILTRDGRRIAILEPIDIQNGAGTHFDEIFDYERNIVPRLREVWASVALKRVALNYSREHYAADGLTHGMYLRLVDALGAEFESAAVSSEDVVMATRAVKTQTEIERLSKACAITFQVFDELGAHIRPGVTDTELGAIAAARARELGATSGEASIAVNGQGQNEKGPLGKEVKAGQVVLFDMGVRYEGYSSDNKYVWYVRDRDNPFPDILERQWNACRASADYALSILKPGEWGYDVHDRAWAKLEEFGFPRDAHSYGHQIGRQVHDAGTWLGDADNPYRPARGKLEENMVFTLDPTINRVGKPDPEWFSMGVEDIAMVTADGGRLLHRPQAQIMVIDW